MFVIQRAIHGQRGFTLVELAIVLVIIGVLVGGFLGTFGSRIDATRNANTKEELESVRQAMLGYALENGGALPCPDTDGDGQEDRGGTPCASGNAVGNVPWVTLGITAVDGWNTVFRYWVDGTFADTGSIYTLTDNSIGMILLRDPGGAGTGLAASNVTAVLLSHGKNSYGGTDIHGNVRPGIPVTNIDELNNTDANAIFISREPTEAGASSAGGEFDDIVIWISEYELKAIMVEAGILP